MPDPRTVGDEAMSSNGSAAMYCDGVSVAARAMLVWSSTFAGAVGFNRYDELQRLEPVTPEDFLFKGQAQSMIDPADAENLLNEAIRRRDSNVARLVRTWVRSRLASFTGDPADAERAVDDATVARSMLGDNPYAEPDSRVFGVVPDELVLARAVARYRPRESYSSLPVWLFGSVRPMLPGRSPERRLRAR